MNLLRPKKNTHRSALKYQVIIPLGKDEPRVIESTNKAIDGSCEPKRDIRNIEVVVETDVTDPIAVPVRPKPNCNLVNTCVL
jgi:hypothetical protein